MKWENQTSQWFQTLSKDLQNKIRRLHAPSPYAGLVIFLFIGIWIVTALLMCQFPYKLILFIGYIIIGFILHSLGTYLHECIHGNMFRNTKLDYWMGCLAGLPVFISFTGYQVNHLLHHKYNRTKQDPDEFTNVSDNSRLLSIVFYSWLLIGMPIYLFRIIIVSFQHGSTKNRFMLICEVAAIVGIISFIIILCIQLNYFSILCNIWLIPLVFTVLMSNIRAWSEHSLTRIGHPLTQSRTITSNRILSFFLCNINYHLEHHLFPAMPWHRLPTLHKLLQNEYSMHSSIYSSFSRFIYDACRVGIHGELSQRK